MKNQIYGFLLLLSFVFSVPAQKAQKADVGVQNLRRDVQYLASDALGGRRTGEAGATSAAGYVANKFADYKLKAKISTAKNGKSSSNYLQEFPFVTGVEAGKNNSFKLELTQAGNRLKVENLLPVKPVAFSPNGEIKDAKIVFAGYGISSAESKYDDYDNLNVSGKIVLVFDGTPDNDDPNSKYARFDVRAKANVAKEKGAVGVMIITRQPKFEDDKLTTLDYDQTLGEAALPTFIVSRNTAANILGLKNDDLEKVESLTAMKKDSAVKVNIGFPETSPVAGFKIDLIKKQTEAYNVIGILEGNDNTLKNEAIVIGAHYDHLGRGGQGSLAVNSTEIHHGADDNASGVAAMLELARQFAKSKNNKRTLIFIAFGGEEEGLLGSKFYVNNPAFPLAKTVAMINMDMVGRLKDDKLTIGGIGTASEWKNIINRINPSGEVNQTIGEENIKAKNVIENALKQRGFNGVRVRTNNTPFTIYGIIGKYKLAEVMQTAMEANGGKPIRNEATESQNMIPTSAEIANSIPFILQFNEDGFGPSDHSSFYGKQIPVLFFFTGSHEDYHKPTDTADKINYDGLLKIENFVGVLVKAIDANPAKPTYTVAKSSGMGEGRRGFNISLGTVPSYAEGTNDGLLLDGVRDDSPAAKSGVKAGDKIIKLAGHDVRNISDYVFVLGEMKAGTEYEIVVKRGAETLTLKIIPAARK